MIAWLLTRLQEKSTICGLIGAFAILAGHVIAPDHLDAIGTIVSFGLSAVAVVVREHKDSSQTTD